MPSVYGQLTKITNASGRQEYIESEEKQEEIVHLERHMTYSWSEYSKFEAEHSQKGQSNNEALEVIVPIPNELYADREKLKSFCDSISREIIQGNNDYEYAVHWNSARTNLHMHLMFSEREPNLSREPKVYKKDIWQDKDTGKLAKANSENAVLVHRKGEVQKDKDGNIKYNEDILGAKNIRFKNKNFVTEKNFAIAKVFQEYGYEMRVQTKESPYLSQRAVKRGDNEDYRIAVQQYNSAVKEYNSAVQEHIELRPEVEPKYCEIRKSVETDIRDENRKERKISAAAIGIVKEMRDFVREEIGKIKSLVSQITLADKTVNWWSENKERILEVFDQHHKNDMEIVTLKGMNETLEERREGLEIALNRELSKGWDISR